MPHGRTAPVGEELIDVMLLKERCLPPLSPLPPRLPWAPIITIRENAHALIIVRIVCFPNLLIVSYRIKQTVSHILSFLQLHSFGLLGG
jgi:hypothetical protein